MIWNGGQGGKEKEERVNSSDVSLFLILGRSERLLGPELLCEDSF